MAWSSKTGSAGSVTGLSDSGGERRRHAGGAIESPHSLSIHSFARSGVGASTSRAARAVGIGVATGSAFVGNIEAADRTIWSAIGSTITVISASTVPLSIASWTLPTMSLTDAAVPFATTGVHGLSQLNVWWLRLGIQHQRTRPASPQENGAHERMHKTLKAEAIRVDRIMPGVTTPVRSAISSTARGENA